jgi:NAD(P)-dependent dehydrogenase (short-subunit alcohol dehydrogenase family)
MDSMLDVAGLRVVVTGVGRGIGRVIAEAFLRGGARVFGCDVDPAGFADAQRALPALAGTVADIADRAAVGRMFEAVDATEGGLDVLVNNAGIAGPMGRVDEIDPREWQRVFDVNVNGAFHCTQEAVPRLRAAGGGSIVNISSAAGRLPYGLRSPYSTSKFALVGFTQCIAMELGASGIRCNAVLPGIVRGERRAGNSQRRALAEGTTVEAIEARSLARVSLGRMIEPEEVAATVLFLASKQGAAISGQSISVCGDLHALVDPVARTTG